MASFDVRPDNCIYCPVCRTDGCQCDVHMLYADVQLWHQPSKQGIFDPSFPRITWKPWTVYETDKPSMHEYIEKCKPLDPNQMRETCIDFNTCTQFETGSVLFEGWITFNKVYGRSGAITTEVNGSLPIFTKNGVLQVCKIAKDQQPNYFHHLQ